MKIEQTNNEKKGQFTAKEGEQEAGHMTYTWAGPEKFIIDHTEVNLAFSGQGVGKKLVMAAVEFARNENIKIVPVCAFAKAVMLKDKSVHDVLA